MSAPIVVRGKVVSIRYVLRNQSGEIFEYSDLPVSYLHGSGRDLFPGIERALEGRAVGERVEVELPPREAFGPRDPALTFTDELDNVPPELRRIGVDFEAQNAKGETVRFVVTRIEGGKLTVDANHALAGQTVRFEVTVQAIRDATAEELQSGRPVELFTPPGA